MKPVFDIFGNPINKNKYPWNGRQKIALWEPLGGGNYRAIKSVFVKTWVLSFSEVVGTWGHSNVFKYGKIYFIAVNW